MPSTTLAGPGWGSASCLSMCLPTLQQLTNIHGLGPPSRLPASASCEPQTVVQTPLHVPSAGRLLTSLLPPGLQSSRPQGQNEPNFTSQKPSPIKIHFFSPTNPHAASSACYDSAQAIVPGTALIGEAEPRANMILSMSAAASVCLGCCDTVPWAGWLEQYRFTASIERLRSRCGQGWFPSRPLSLAGSQPSSLV